VYVPDAAFPVKAGFRVFFRSGIILALPVCRKGTGFRAQFQESHG
jgi:hypothetical protein